MDRIELQMDKTVFVLGAGIIASLKHQDNGLVQECISRLRLENTAQSNALLVQTQLEQLLTNFPQSSSRGLSLADFQRKGALLAYLYADKTIDQALDQSSLTATNVDKWVEQSTTGIMHLFGVCNDIDSMQYLENDTTVIPDSLLHVFKHKVCVCIGFDQEGQTDLQAFLNQLPLREMPNVLLPCSSMSKIEAATLGLPVSVANYFEKLTPAGNSTKALGERLDHDDHSVLGQPLSLLMAANKTADYMKTAMLLSTLPGMNFQLMNTVKYDGTSFNLLTVQVEYTRFREFWCAIMQPNIVESLINQTVMAIILNQFTFIWLRTTDHEGSSVTTDALRVPTSLVPKAFHGRTKYSLLVHAAKQIKMVHSKYSTIAKTSSKRSTNGNVKNGTLSLNNNHSNPGAINNRSSSIRDKRSSLVRMLAQNSQPLQSNRNAKQRSFNSIKSTPYKTLQTLLKEPPMNFKVSKFNINCLNKSTLITKQKQFINECREWSVHMDKVWEKKKAAAAMERDKTANKAKKSKSNEVVDSHKRTRQESSSVAVGTSFSLSNCSIQQPSIMTQQQNILAPSVPLPFHPISSKPIFSTAVTPITPFIKPTATPSIPPAAIAPSPLQAPTIPIPPSIVTPSFSLAKHPSLTPSIPIRPPSMPPTNTPVIPHSIPTVPPGIHPSILPNIPMAPSPLQTATTPIMYPSAYLSSYPFLTSSINFPYLLRNPTSSLMLAASGSNNGLPPLANGIAHPIADRNSSSQAALPPCLSSLPHTFFLSSADDALATKRIVNHDTNSPLYEDNPRNLPLQNQSRTTAHSVSPPSSDKDESSPSTYAMSCDSPDEIDIEEDSIPLWKFIIELLLLNSHSHVVSWRQVHSLEFQIKQPLELVRVWGLYKAEGSSQKSTECNYKKFRGALHYYSIKDQPILRCISVKDEIYRFSDSMIRYINNCYLLKKNEASVFNFSSLERNARCPDHKRCISTAHHDY